MYEDRRKGLQSSLQKREQIEQARVMAELGLERYDLEVLETRGDRTALCRETWHVADFEIAILLVGRVDDEGRGVVAVMFDDKDLDAARAELDAQGVQP